jgi:hypothetical protein
MRKYTFWVQLPDGTRLTEVVELPVQDGTCAVRESFALWATPKIKAHVGVLPHGVTPYGWEEYRG